MATTGKRRVVIIGGGFGGLAVAKRLSSRNVDVTLFDKNNYHVFSPLLYQVASAALSPGDIAQPIRTILRKVENVHVVMQEVIDIDSSAKTVSTAQNTVRYDDLVIATGTMPGYFGHDDWETHAPGLKTLHDALSIRERMLSAFEAVVELHDDQRKRTLLTFVIVGGGPTGVEMAGSIAEIGLKTMLPDYPRLRRDDIRIVLIEGGPRLLPAFHESLSERTCRDLQRMGVEVHLNTFVNDIQHECLELRDGSVIHAATIVWAAGNVGSPLLEKLNIRRDGIGRAIVQDDCSIEGLDDVYVIGDTACFVDKNGNPLPGVCQTAIQQGTYVAKAILDSATRAKPFVYLNKGNMATIGRAKAVAEVFGMKLSGLIAWWLWATIHIFYLIGFRNRIRVFVEWLWYYISYQPGARLITDGERVKRDAHR